MGTAWGKAGLIVVVGVLFIAAIAGLAAVTEPAGPINGQELEKTFKKKITRTVSARYMVFLPKGYAPEGGQTWPLIMFLHGSGERGDNLNLVRVHGPLKVAETQPDFPFIVVAPQCARGQWWDPDVLSALLDEVEKKYAVDKDRVYLTGLSMGGFGTWDLAIREPQRFAAIAPVCGRGDPLQAPRLGNLPVWVFHGAKDTVVNPKYSEDMVDALKDSGGDVKFTLYPDLGHDCWTATYSNPDLYTWFLAHKRKPLKGD